MRPNVTSQYYYIIDIAKFVSRVLSLRNYYVDNDECGVDRSGEGAAN